MDHGLIALERTHPMTLQNQGPSRHVAVVGGGLAGLAAAVAFCEHGWRVDLFEARRQLGGRAGSYYDSTTGEVTDHCQHVSLGCCTNFQDLCRRTGMTKFFRRDRELTFIGPDGKRSTVRAVQWLPAPLHLGPGLSQLCHLPFSERIAIARTLWRLARIPLAAVREAGNMEQWLESQGATRRAQDDFWSVILVSALAERLDRISLADGRKVLVEGFMANTSGYELQIPTVPLGKIYQEHLVQWLANRAAICQLATPVRRIILDKSAVQAVELDNGSQRRFDGYVLAIPWRRVREVILEPPSQLTAQWAGISQIESSPITGVHLRFDRPITDLPHAVIVGRLSQWLFNRGAQTAADPRSPAGHYYQVVISASRNLDVHSRNAVIAQVQDDLCSIFPAARGANLIHSRLITQRDAVFVIPPDVFGCRPAQRTPLDNLALAGDWTDTGWPATMEGAVRSGYLAAEVLLRAHGHRPSVLVTDQPYGWLARWLLRR